MRNKIDVRCARSPHGGIDSSFGLVGGHYVPNLVGRGFGKLRNEEVTTRDYKLKFMQFLVLTLQTTLPRKRIENRLKLITGIGSRK
jgi:hypothetical protein